MDPEKNQTSKRKKDHIDICLNEEVNYKTKTSGFENYEFFHNAMPNINFKNISLETEFLKKKISYPLLISCMTGGTIEAESINSQLAMVADELNIAIGVGSQRQALEDDSQIQSYKTIRKNAPNVPVLGNIGAAQVVSLKKFGVINRLVESIEADAMVVHLNPLQELFQKNGETDFHDFYKSLEKMVSKADVPIIVKEVGSGINYKVAKRLLNSGVKGIDVAGAGGTSWAGVELLRNKEDENNPFWDWGLPTSFCLTEVNKLANHWDFILIASGGITNGIEIAKSIALGADIAASARKIFIEINENGIDGTVALIQQWMLDLQRVMFLTGCSEIFELKEQKLIRRENLY